MCLIIKSCSSIVNFSILGAPVSHRDRTRTTQKEITNLHHVFKSSESSILSSLCYFLRSWITRIPPWQNLTPSCMYQEKKEILRTRTTDKCFNLWVISSVLCAPLRRKLLIVHFVYYYFFIIFIDVEVLLEYCCHLYRQHEWK